MQIFILVLITGVSVEFNNNYLLRLLDFSKQDILLPFSQINIDKNEGSALFESVNVFLTGKGKQVVFADSYFKSDLPEALMVSNIQALANGSNQIIIAESEEEQSESEITLPEYQEEKLNKKTDYSSFFQGYRVVFYCTHGAESYIPDSGRARCEGQRGLVNKVAAEMSNSLKTKGLDAEFINTLHDYPEYNNSYTKSRETVNSILESKQNILALFDIHRDSIPGLNNSETVEINGKKSARILIIVGTDERKPHDNWRENLDFAQRLSAQADKMYPGLIKAVRTKAGTYNQEYFPNSLLLELGSDINSFAEANYAGELFTDVIIEVLKEEIQ
ncbi:MAG: stage II sporulation protein P [Syntrophomonadaceae bacterium]|nr:stage II sporulation protein P [Syntrophomonadaceae bacterium]